MKSQSIKERFSLLLDELKKSVYEKDTEIGMSLLAAIAGESVLLLGPPGVAKSMVARRIKLAFKDARSFEYLMSRFSTPDEIFGPVSISKLKTDDMYERNMDGFMPTSDVVFLDEIWKAGPAILNTLLTIINEKTFRNGNVELPVPLKLLMGASNELPADGEGLEALWDRFLVRMVSGCVKDEDNFYRILCEESQRGLEPDMKSLPCITAKEYAEWGNKIHFIGIDAKVFDAITFIRKHLSCLNVNPEDDSAARMHNIYVSDRRWKHIMHLLRTSAFVHGRENVECADLPLLVHCLWNEPEEIPALRMLIIQSVFFKSVNYADSLSAKLSVENKRTRAREAMREMMLDNYHRDDNKKLYDGFYYLIDNYGTGNTYIFFVDYKNLKGFNRIDAAQEGIIYTDPKDKKKKYIRMMSDTLGLADNQVSAMRVKLYRDDDCIYINGVKYAIHLLARGESQRGISDIKTDVQPSVDYESIVEELSTDSRTLAESICQGNILVTNDDRKEVDLQMKDLNHKIALLRIEIQKLLYGEGN